MHGGYFRFEDVAIVCDRISMRFFGEVAWLDFPLDKANEEKT
jgi:hypothetical protein